jgi:hypothetical protein
MKRRLGEIAYARSGDKGASANIGVIARRPEDYSVLVAHLTADRVHGFFSHLGVSGVKRYELPNLGALNFILHDALDGGASLSLRTDAQGKALAQQLLAMELDVPNDECKA